MTSDGTRNVQPKRLEWGYPDTYDADTYDDQNPPGGIPMWPPAPVPADYVNTASIQNGAVTTPKLANDAVDATKLANNAVDTAAIQNVAVTTGKIANGAVTTTQLATNAVATGNIQALAVTEPKLADNSVSTRTIAPFTVGVSQIDNDFLDRILATGPQSAVSDFSGNAIGNAMSTTQGNVILNILRTAGIIET